MLLFIGVSDPQTPRVVRLENIPEPCDKVYSARNIGRDTSCAGPRATYKNLPAGSTCSGHETPGGRPVSSIPVWLKVAPETRHAFRGGKCNGSIPSTK